jgi:hypothetical protein
MYGDPRGYKYNGKPEFYHYTGNLFLDRLTEIYLWSMDRRDLERIPTDRGWIGFLEGKNPTYPEKELADDFEHIRKRMELMRNDATSPDTRLADYLQGMCPPPPTLWCSSRWEVISPPSHLGASIAGCAILILRSDAPACPRMLQRWWKS